MIEALSLERDLDIEALSLEYELEGGLLYIEQSGKNHTIGE